MLKAECTNSQQLLLSMQSLDLGQKNMLSLLNLDIVPVLTGDQPGKGSLIIIL